MGLTVFVFVFYRSSAYKLHIPNTRSGSKPLSERTLRAQLTPNKEGGEVLRQQLILLKGLGQSAAASTVSLISPLHLSSSQFIQ